MVDDSHAVGFVGENGRGSHEYCDVMGRVTSSPVRWVKRLVARLAVIPLRVKRWWSGCASAPSVPVLQLPRAAIVAASIKVLEMVESGAELRDRLWSNARLFREK